MANYYVPLPRYNPGPQGIDFSPINRGLDAVGQKIEKNRLLDQNKQIGSALQSGDYDTGANKAFEFGDLNTGMQLRNAQRDIQNTQYQRQRQAAADRRASAAEGRSSELHGLRVQKTQDDLRTSLINRTAGIAERIRNETDPARKQQLMTAFVNAHPRLQTQFKAYNLDPANPDPVLDMIISEARGLSGGASKPIKVGNDLVQQGPDGQYVPVYQGQPKPQAPSATAMREIFEADEGAQASSNVLSSLDTALELNDKAYSGIGAETRGYLTSLYGAEGGEATEQLQNVVTQQVLENLKSTFGGMPTEGERQILLQVQGSVNKSPEVRKRIYEAAKQAAQRRLEFNRQKASGIRSGEYFQPGYSPQGNVAPPQPSTNVDSIKQKYGLE